MPFDLQWALASIWIGVAVVWIVAAFGNKPAVKREVSPSLLIQFVVKAAAFVLMTNASLWNGAPILRDRIVPETAFWGWLAIALTCAGMTFALSARFYLGREWSGTVTLKREHELKRGGPYSIVRHPIYTGLTLAAFGTTIGIGEVRAFAAMPLILIGWRIKANMEERFRTEQFGEQYESYRHDVKWLIPFVW
jgi:protein-S-isoprenylcysteine O-methyltransferase Ste14